MKHSLHCSTAMVIFLLLISTSLTALAQEEQEATKPKRRIPLLSFYIGGSYFAPSYTDLNTVYQKIEQLHNFPSGGDFKNFYSVSAGVRFAPLSQHFFELEAGGSVYKAQPSVEGQTISPTNYLQLSSLGASYIVSFPTPFLIVSIGGGAGYIWLHSQRSYPAEAIVRVNGELLELHAMVGGEFFHSSGTSAGVRIGYSYATTIYPTNADVDITLKGLTVKAFLSVPLVRI